MRYLIFLTLLTITKSDHISKNDSSVIITYAGHVEAADTRILTPKPDAITEKSSSTDKVTFGPGEDKDTVLFVPNEKEVKIVVNENLHDELKDHDGLKVNEVMANRKTVGDIISGKFVEEENTEEPPDGDILFISGKNMENVEKPTRINEGERQQHADVIRSEGIEKQEPPKPKLDCKNLDCDNAKDAVCGGKLENRTWKYRLFLNDCFFRKVSCNFMYDINRYSKVSINKCKDIGAHYSERPSVYNPMAPPPRREDSQAQRRSSGRRANNVNPDGSLCDHACPTACTEEYEPECGVSSTGARKVFTNHCYLDLHSCKTLTVWRRKQLADCVGSRKADIRQNRSFIGWMQRIGIVDTKGKLVMA